MLDQSVFLIMFVKCCQGKSCGMIARCSTMLQACKHKRLGMADKSASTMPNMTHC